MFRKAFPMRYKERRGKLCDFSIGKEENAAISLVVLQSAEILGLIICFAIHFLCVTIE